MEAFHWASPGVVMTDYPYQVALPESYALKYARREVHKDATRLGASTLHRMAKRAGVYFCVYSFTTERHMGAFMRRHGGKPVEPNGGWERIVVR